MSAGVRGRARGVLLPLMLLGMLCAAPVGTGSVSLEDDAVGAAIGAGTWDQILCIGCAAGFVAAGGMTIAGTFLVAALYPEAAIACASTCVAAF